MSFLKKYQCNTSTTSVKPTKHSLKKYVKEINKISTSVESFVLEQNFYAKVLGTISTESLTSSSLTYVNAGLSKDNKLSLEDIDKDVGIVKKIAAWLKKVKDFIVKKSKDILRWIKSFFLNGLGDMKKDCAEFMRISTDKFIAARDALIKYHPDKIIRISRFQDNNGKVAKFDLASKSVNNFVSDTDEALQSFYKSLSSGEGAARDVEMVYFLNKYYQPEYLISDKFVIKMNEETGELGYSSPAFNENIDLVKKLDNDSMIASAKSLATFDVKSFNRICESLSHVYQTTLDKLLSIIDNSPKAPNSIKKAGKMINTMFMVLAGTQRYFIELASTTTETMRLIVKTVKDPNSIIHKDEEVNPVLALPNKP